MTLNLNLNLNLKLKLKHSLRCTSKTQGDAAEDLALAYLQKAGLHLLARNYKIPQRGGAEIDLIMRDGEGTLVFVEVRQRSRADFGGACASVNRAKQARIARAALHYLQNHVPIQAWPPCRFDVVGVGAVGIEWLQAAFDHAD